MQPTEFLKNLSARLSQALPPELQTLKKDCDKTIHSILCSAFAELDLVTRDEFDAQTKVLARTRQKVEQLARELAALEASLPRHPDK
jgi:BMFP domain-containing protein YqiC